MTAAPAPRPREPRIDCFRGIALWFMFTLHLSEFLQAPALKLISWHTYGFTDAAELFVFLAGLTFGFVHSPERAGRGLGPAWRASLRRALELYLANLGTFLVLLLLLPALCTPLGWRNPWAEWWAVAPLDRLRRLALLISTPGYFNILPLFVQLLCCMPLLRALHRRSPAAAWAVSGGVYGLSLLFPLTPLLAYRGFTGGLTLYFNPFAWQFLFFIGMAVGLRHHATPAPLPSPRWLLHAALLFLLLAAMAKVRLYLVNYNLPALGSGAAYKAWLDPLLDKPSLQPLRLLHILALCWAASRLAPGPEHRLWQTGLARGLRAMGRQSLLIFCLHVVLCYVLVLALLNTRNTLPMQLAAHCLGWAAMLAVAVALDRLRRPKLGVAPGPPLR